MRITLGATVVCIVGAYSATQSAMAFIAVCVVAACLAVFSGCLELLDNGVFRTNSSPSWSFGACSALVAMLVLRSLGATGEALKPAEALVLLLLGAAKAGCLRSGCCAWRKSLGVFAWLPRLQLVVGALAMALGAAHLLAAVSFVAPYASVRVVDLGFRSAKLSGVSLIESALLAIAAFQS